MCTLFDFCINPSHEGNHSQDLYKGSIYAKATNDMELTHLYCAVCSDDIHSQLERNDWVSTLFDFCINPSHEGNHSQDLYKGRIYAKATNDMELTHLYCAVCSDDIHSQLERNDWVSTLFDFCINPSLEDSVKAVY